MGGKSGPDYGDIATAQGEENREVVRDQLYANRPDQYTPYGYNKWTTEMGEDGTERWSQTQGLTPQLQEILNKQIAMQGGRTDLAGGLTGRMMSEYGQPMDWGGVAPGGGITETQLTGPESLMRNIQGDPTAMRGRAEDAVYGKGASRLDPQFQGRRDALEVKLRNQGLGPEDAAYKAQMGGLGQQETDAYGQLQGDALLAGRGEQQQSWQQAQDQANFYNQSGGQAFNQNLGANEQNFRQGITQSAQANQIRQQQMAEKMQQRGFGLNEINALLHGQQVQMPNMPDFRGAESAKPAPIYQGGVDQGNYDQGQQQMLYEGVGSLAGAFF